MSRSVVLVIGLLCLLGCLLCTEATAQDSKNAIKPDKRDNLVSAISDDPTDPDSILEEGRERAQQRESLISFPPLQKLYDKTAELKSALNEKTGFSLGLTINHLFQGVTHALPNQQQAGMTTDSDIVGSWALINRGKPSQGKAYCQLEGRWDYGTTGPQDLGFVSLGTAGGTANAFSAYKPAFLIRNLYWEQGSPEAGWAFRVGKVTPDAILATSRHISPVTTFLSNVATGLFSSGYPDSGLGFVGAVYFTDKFKVIGLVSDANADRYDWGDPGAGDLYKALELAYKIFPRTQKSGFSKFTIWHNDGTKDGNPINASTGRSGWGMTVKLEQELTADGRFIGVLRWGRSWDDSSIYEQQAGLNLLYYEPFNAIGLRNDVIGLAGNWVDSVDKSAGQEFNLEFFYRFRLLPGIDMRLSYQSIFNPAFNSYYNQASAFSLGLRTVF